MAKHIASLFITVALSFSLWPQGSIAQTASSQIANNSVENQLGGEPLPLLKIAECDHQGSVYQSAEFGINIQGSTLRVQGRDQSGNAWNAQARFNSPGCEVFEGDLSGTGRNDIVALIPGIGDTGVYDTRLIVLLFDAAGKPCPWSATGRFTSTSHGIQQIRTAPTGGALILHTYMAGHPAWGGVTYVSRLYQVKGSTIALARGSSSQLNFPVLTGARSNDPAFIQSINSFSLSTPSANTSETSLPRVVRYGPDSSATVPQQTAPLSAEQAANLTVDINAVNASTKHLVLSDGSKIDIPTILVIDSLTGSREINFVPESSDLAQLEKRPYAIQSRGEDCSDPDNCRPFIIRAMEQNQ